MFQEVFCSGYHCQGLGYTDWQPLSRTSQRVPHACLHVPYSTVTLQLIARLGGQFRFMTGRSRYRRYRYQPIPAPWQQCALPLPAVTSYGQ
jgi:hypothetical protein